MNRFLPTVLFLSSLACFTGCSPLRGYKKTGVLVPAAKPLSPFSNVPEALLYRAEIDIAGKHFSGLLLFKQFDPVKRLTFVSEVGMTIFDLELSDQQVKVVSMFEPINRPTVVSVLTEDMQRIFTGNFSASEEFVRDQQKAYRQKKELNHYFFYGEDKLLDKMIIKGSVFKKAQAVYGYQGQDFPQTIRYTRKSLVKIRIKLNKIEKNAS